MGCICGKMAGQPPTATAAFSRDLSLSLKGRIADFPPVEDLFSPRAATATGKGRGAAAPGGGEGGGGDHFFSFLYATNAVAIKFESEDHHHRHDDDDDSPSNEKSTPAIDTDEPTTTTPETINTWELMADLEEGEGEGEEEEGTTSKEEIERPGPPPPSADDPANSEALGRRWSSCAEKEEEEEGSEDFPGQEDLSESEQRSGDHCNSCFTAAAEMMQSPSPSPSPEDVIEEEQRPPSDLTRMSCPREEASSSCLLRRRIAMRDLKVKVPSFDFSSGDDGQQRQQLGADGSYETPKFGSYGRRIRPEDNGGAVFDPKLVAELQQALERLTEEEDDLLRQIVHGCCSSIQDVVGNQESG